eukprot:607155-Hanusia_phi.AAC.5
MGTDIALSFEACDVTAGKQDDANKRIFQAAHTFDLFIFSYVANETSDKARKTGLRDRDHSNAMIDSARKAKRGAVMIFADVMQHSRCVLHQIADTMNASPLGGKGISTPSLEATAPASSHFNRWWMGQEEFPELKAEVLILHKT